MTDSDMEAMLTEQIVEVDQELEGLRGRSGAADRIEFLEGHRRYLTEARARFGNGMRVEAGER